ncbi:putative carboxypeptidase suro-1 isoform X2 [Haematobia irritans]|uniref:putative carboxypeptidase suro-1 isoform X2 n=1 Tax=Haematobia irritans TaxID=7368 RepID=UPI003F500795
MASSDIPLVVAGTHINLNSYSYHRNLPKIALIKLNRTAANRLKSSPAIVGAGDRRKHSKPPVVAVPRLIDLPRPDVLNCYLSYNDILMYLEYLRIRFSEFVKIHTLGLSYERRPIRAIEIHWNSESNLWAQAKENRIRSAPVYRKELQQLEICPPEKGPNIVFIEGGTHAREWITVTVALHCIHQLTEKNGRHRELLRKLRFFIVPVVNPDGYEYSKNTNPRWRKNRRPHPDDGYVGTDCNRNFDIHWDQCKSKAKKNTYPGDKPFSEPETKALAQILHKLAPKILLFLSLHSYAQCIMYPWGYSKSLPSDYKLMESVAMAARNAIKTHSGRYYRVGSISSITKRIIAGSVVDYAYGVVKIPLALVMELPSNEYGFQPPVEKISPLSTESWCGIREMCKQAYELKSQIDKYDGEEASTKTIAVKIEGNNDNLKSSAIPVMTKEEEFNVPARDSIQKSEDTINSQSSEIGSCSQTTVVNEEKSNGTINSQSSEFDSDSQTTVDIEDIKDEIRPKFNETNNNNAIIHCSTTEKSEETTNRQSSEIGSYSQTKVVIEEVKRAIRPKFNVKKNNENTISPRSISRAYFSSLLDYMD